MLRAGNPSPVLSSTTRGLPCLLGYPWSGGLLPHLFTLTPRRGAGRYFFCCTFHPARLAPRRPSFSRGALPCGVRTFLKAFAGTNQRLPRDRPGSGRSRYTVHSLSKSRNQGDLPEPRTFRLTVLLQVLHRLTGFLQMLPPVRFLLTQKSLHSFFLQFPEDRLQTSKLAFDQPRSISLEALGFQ